MPTDGEIRRTPKQNRRKFIDLYTTWKWTFTFRKIKHVNAPHQKVVNTKRINRSCDSKTLHNVAIKLKFREGPSAYAVKRVLLRELFKIIKNNVQKCFLPLRPGLKRNTHDIFAPTAYVCVTCTVLRVGKFSILFPINSAI